jgi:LuxR family maltose regulon positive regulatory protein
MAFAGLSGLHREWNELDAAARYALEAVQLGRGSGFTDSLLHGCITAARVRQSQGDWRAADELLQEAERIVQRTKIPQSTAGITVERARLWLRQLRLKRDKRLLHAVDRWVDSSTLSDDWRQPGPTIFLPNHQPDFEHLTLARAFILQERLDEAQRLLAWLLEAAEAVGRTRSVVEIQALQALTRGAQGQIEPAMNSLQQALSLGAAVGYVRLFVDEGRPMAELLRQAMARGIVPGYVGELQSAFEARERPPLPASPSVSHLVEPLSARELEVLQLVAAGRSNREAAEQLFIATSTIKKHLENIYGKLEVHSRTEAVARARELNLL